MDKTKAGSARNYSFNLDIQLSAGNYVLALQQIVELLNDHPPIQYKINSGSEIGGNVDALISSLQNAIPHTPSFDNEMISFKDTNDEMKAELYRSIQDNRLKSLQVVHDGASLSFPCRILSIDEDTQSFTVYHVDQKQVFSFYLCEITKLT